MSPMHPHYRHVVGCALCAAMLTEALGLEARPHLEGSEAMIPPTPRVLAIPSTATASHGATIRVGDLFKVTGL